MNLQEWKVLTDRDLRKLESALNDNWVLTQVATTNKQIVYILKRDRPVMAAKKK